MNHKFRFSTSGNPTKHMPIGCWSLWGQRRSVTSGDLSWPWNSHNARSRVTASHALTPIISTIPIQVNRTTPSCIYSRFRWNLVEGCSLCYVITSWPDLTWPNCFHQKLHKIRPISNGKFQHDTPKGVASSREKHMGVASTSPPPPSTALANRPKTKFVYWKAYSHVPQNAAIFAGCRKKKHKYHANKLHSRPNSTQRTVISMRVAKYEKIWRHPGTPLRVYNYSGIRKTLRLGEAMLSV